MSCQGAYRNSLTVAAFYVHPHLVSSLPEGHAYGCIDVRIDDVGRTCRSTTRGCGQSGVSGNGRVPCTRDSQQAGDADGADQRRNGGDQNDIVLTFGHLDQIFTPERWIGPRRLWVWCREAGAGRSETCRESEAAGSG